MSECSQRWPNDVIVSSDVYMRAVTDLQFQNVYNQSNLPASVNVENNLYDVTHNKWYTLF